jgi:hypothetical protein
MPVLRSLMSFLLLIAVSLARESPHHYAYRPVSIAFVPGFSTNGPSARYVSSSFSLNIIGGNLGRLRGVELGSVFNVEEDEVAGSQTAGVFNIVGGGFTGLQLAGVINVVGDGFYGAQMTGVVNVTGGSLVGAQIAGVTNAAGDGFGGAQLAGVANIAAGQTSGLQLAGVVNVAEELSGAQVGLVNIAGESRGLQLGLVNIAEEAEVPIGLVSIVKHGQFHVNAWATEFSPVNVGIKTGSNTIYSVFMLGSRPRGDSGRLFAGLGTGGHIPLKRFFVDIDVLSHGVYTGPDWFAEGGSDLLSSLRLTGGWQLNEGLALTAGPTVSVWVSGREDGARVPCYDLPLFESHGSENVRIWPGFTVGLQIL